MIYMYKIKNTQCSNRQNLADQKKKTDKILSLTDNKPKGINGN